MSHLGDRLSALVDGELNGVDRERAHAHMAVCEQCRMEAAALRDLKRQLRDLRTLPADTAVVGRLLEMAGPGGPIPPRQPRRGLGGGRQGPGASRPAPHRGRAGRMGRRGRRGRRGRMGRRGYVVAGAVSLVVVGIGAAAFSVGGGGGGSSGPDITPPMQMYSEEHAITTGDVPFPVLSPVGASPSSEP